jgi:NAD(P)-dependent dehydrogenase (short-subunit alcohol dehydrogenase family)
MSGSLRDELRPLGISATVVAPGGFRTDFSGRSLTRSRTAIDDCAETAGRRRKEHDTTHGTRPGDPARAGRAVLTAVESADPPVMLLLGSDALTSYRQVLGTALAEAGEWEELSVSTDFQD